VKRIAAALALAVAAFFLVSLPKLQSARPVASDAHLVISQPTQANRPAVMASMAHIPAPVAPHAIRPMADPFALDAQLRGGLEAAADDSAADIALAPVALTPQRVSSMPTPPIAASEPSERPRARPEGAADDEGS
jgi:hypothetical protein